jgi:UDP:flavonoid glycosyltransferase YjiC (YdhE family)
MMHLAKAFVGAGVHVTIACSEQFRDVISAENLRFVPLTINRNVNTGVAVKTRQPEKERERLNNFLESTRMGAIETLMLQACDRRLDMLPDPERLIEEVRSLQTKENPDMYVVNQLSYGVTLSMYCLKLPFITLCLPHPASIPDSNTLFGVPVRWPSPFAFDTKKLNRLASIARKMEKQFTDEYNRIIRKYDNQLKRVTNAFRLTSPEVILYNYPDFWEAGKKQSLPRKIFMGYCFQKQKLACQWRETLKKKKHCNPKILIVMGTFLSARDDVLTRCIQATKTKYPESLIIMGAGASTHILKNLKYNNLIVEEFIPQKGLLPSMDVVIHHGGCNSFTEALFFGKSMLILPFSSDQFDVAYDAEKQGIGVALDPNAFKLEEFQRKLQLAIEKKQSNIHTYWRKKLSRLGPHHAVDILLK